MRRSLVLGLGLIAVVVAAGTAAAAAPAVGPEELIRHSDRDGDGRIAGAARVYVRADADGGDGRSWATAIASVQAGIDAAAKRGGGEVWVARGTYYPTVGSDRDATFRLRGGVAVYGGFAGNETDRQRRDVPHNATILSGDIGRRGVTGDNCYHVVTGADNALIDGLTITGGEALEGGGRPFGPPGGGRGGPPGSGGIHTSPDAILSGANRGFGAGMLNFQCAPTVCNCTFAKNHAGKGGAVYNMTSRSFPPRRERNAAPLFVDCRFVENHARGRGGAVANDLGTSPTFRGCTFTANACDEKGGAVYNDFACSPTLVNCLFAENHAASAAALGNDGGSSPRIVHCTFTRNLADEEGAAIYQGTGPANDPLVLGCILWDDRCPNGPAEVFNWHDNDPQVTGSCVQGGYPGEGNMAVDPSFVDPEHGDYRPRADSPCVKLGYTSAAPAELPPVADTRPPFPGGRRPDYEPDTTDRRPTQPTKVPVIYVNAANAVGTHDGKSWRTAYASLREALAATGDQPAEVWVAAGTYRPTGGTNRSASFALHEGLSLYGGFRGTETRRADRDYRANPTILSGDIGRRGDRSDNCYHVLVGADDAVLDGFTIRDGQADGRTYDAHGGGMINYCRGPQAGPMGEPTGYSPTVRNCVFAANRAREGGAVYNYDRSTPQFVACRFEKNAADYGGAMVDRVGVRSTLSGCEFLENEARWRAGALYLDYGARPKIAKCRFEGNRSQCHGGAIATISRASQLEATIPVLAECTFSKNTAGVRGGAIANSDHATLGLDRCTFSGNQALIGGALASTGRSRVVAVQCEFSSNRSAEGDAHISSEGQSTVTADPSVWPDQSSRSVPRGFGPPMP